MSPSKKCLHRNQTTVDGRMFICSDCGSGFQHTSMDVIDAEFYVIEEEEEDVRRLEEA